jgi:hypothetical protein
MIKINSCNAAIIKKRIFINQNKFHKIVHNIIREKKESRVVQLCSQAAIFATNNPCGIFNSKEIEKVLLSIANNNSIDLTREYQRNSFLHVMTRCYSTGGHTRICERWIESSDPIQTHSVALISQGIRKTPALLRKNIKKRMGHLLYISGNCALDKALSLREIASRYEYIVLHIHPYDVVPLLAFGNKFFKRPVILYNHADSLFWLGVSIADLVVSFRSHDIMVNKKYRGIKNNYLLPIPIQNTSDQISNKQNKESIRTKLGVKSKDKILVTAARSYKYHNILGVSFIDVIKRILVKHENAVLLVIGPSRKERIWSKLSSCTNGRVRVLGVLEGEELEECFSIADVAIGSFPLPSPTALLDIARYDVPCISLRICGSLDSFDEAGVSCANIKEFESKLGRLIVAGESQKKMQLILNRDHSPEGFKEKLQDLVRSFPDLHHITEFKGDNRKLLTKYELLIAGSQMSSVALVQKKLYYNVQRILYLYSRFFYPFGMNSRFYNFFSSYGLF